MSTNAPAGREAARRGFPYGDTVNAARRARQKAKREHAHPHVNRKGRTSEKGKVTPCPYCRPEKKKWER